MTRQVTTSRRRRGLPSRPQRDKSVRKFQMTIAELAPSVWLVFLPKVQS